MRPVCSLLLCSFVLLPACSDDSGGSPDGSTSDSAAITVDNHGCDHLQYGPYPAVSGGADRGSAGQANFHSASKVALEAGESVYIKFDSTEMGEYGLFSDNADLQLVLEDDSGATLTPTATAKRVSVCSEVKLKQLYDLSGGKTYFVKLTLAAAATVTVVLVPPLSGHGGDGGHGEGHGGDGMHHGDGHVGDAMHHGDGHVGDAMHHGDGHAGDAKHGDGAHGDGAHGDGAHGG